MLALRNRGVTMLRKLLILGICAGSSASVPILYQSNPEVFHRMLKSAVEDTAPVEPGKTSVNTVRPKAAAETLLGRKVLITANASGHFTADFKLNGRKIDAMVDTGATLVALNLSTARRIGIQLMPEDFKYTVETANGPTRAASTTIKSLQIGRIVVENVQAIVLNDNALGNTLIGISFLNRLEKYQVENGTLLMVQ
jgi:aspartyl protease family protein